MAIYINQLIIVVGVEKINANYFFTYFSYVFELEV